MTTPESPLPNLLGFIADEDKEFQASLARDRSYRSLGPNPGFLRGGAGRGQGPRNEIPIFQLFPLLTFSHYQFLNATAALMRCHPSEMFGGVRIAIDAALIGAQIIDDRGSQIAWVKREKPFTNLARYYGNLVKDKSRSRR